ncbi:hypothetical protein FRC00_011744 [Tulasnella sp. 408]|nr:hypothetical protein FRC00_011744 [Tulasnella sp. 408]
MQAPPTYTQVDTHSETGATDALPGYSDPNAPSYGTFVPSAGVDDKLPNHFKINDQYAKAQVMPSDLEAHLVLLGAFHRLREEIRTFKGRADVPMEPDERYAVFLQRAVYRFEQWAVRMIGGEGQEEEELGEGTPRILGSDEVPPLDVMMVWHTYMLNPRSYYEDCIRKLPGLLRIGYVAAETALEELAHPHRPLHRSFPLMQLAGSVARDTLHPHPPSEGRVAAFNSFTGQPFDPPIDTTSEDTVVVFCPSCSQPNTIPWITYKGDGYAQRGFSCGCNSCQFLFSREVPDHDDKVSQGALSDAYDKTAEAWKARFGVPYSVCGCLPPIKSLEVPGSDSRGSFWSFSKKGKAKAQEKPKFENPRPDLISVADEAAEQMHPSDHNAVAIINPGEQNMAQAQLRKKELGKREKELEKSIEKGKADQWAEVVKKRVTDHTPSFLCNPLENSGKVVTPRRVFVYGLTMIFPLSTVTETVLRSLDPG